MERRSPHRPLLLVLALFALLAFAPSASADLIFGSPGSGAGQYEIPGGVAVDTANGHVYVTDRENNRVDVFEESGAFLFAFGWKVNATTPEEKLQTCTAASGCQKGAAGAGAGQLERPNKITVDSSSHAVYVGEEENHRVQRFDSTGGFIWMVGGEVDKTTHANLCTLASGHVCGAGMVGNAGAGQFAASSLLPLAVGPGDIIYVGDSPSEPEGFDNRIEEFDPSGAFVKQLGPLVPTGKGNGTIRSIAVDSVGNIYLAQQGSSGGARKYDESGTLVTAWGEGGEVDPSSNIHAIALDPAGHLFVADPQPVGQAQFLAGQIFEYDSSGAKDLVFFFDGLETEFGVGSLAFHHTATGDLYATEAFGGGIDQHPRVVQFALPPAGPLLVPGSTEASPVGSVKATLKVGFNAENMASKAHFQYISKAAYVADGNEFGAGTQTTPDSPETPADFANHTVEATNTCVVPTEPTCLIPETTYYFRAFATNAAGTVESKEKAEFTTRAPLEIGALWASEVGVDSVRLHAEVNPVAVHATGRFQYIPEGPDYQAHGFEHATETSVVDFGAGEAFKAAAAQISGLQPATVYHYRLLGSDPYFPPVLSEAHVFATFLASEASSASCPNQVFRSGPSAILPDCRAYELVSPLDKENGDVFARINFTGYPTNLDQSSSEGSGFTYSSYRAFANPQGAPYTNQYLAARHERGQAEEGWQSASIDPPRDALFRNGELENAYKAFSTDLRSSWLLQEGEPTLDACAPAGFADLYRRESATGAFEALSCAQPNVETKEFQPELEGFSADGSDAVFRIDDRLLPEASGTGNYQVYESTGAGTLHLVSVLPNGEADTADSSAGTALTSFISNHNRLQSLKGAVSADGTRIFWSSGLGSGPIYLRLNADQAQSKLNGEGKCSQPARACTTPVSETISPEPAYFQAADPQGTEALFTVTAGALKGNLYRFDAEAKPPASQLIAKGVRENILGASEDLSRVYFASEEATPAQQAEGAINGKPNVYLYDEGATRFLATLSSVAGTSDVKNLYGSPTALTPIQHTARVAPDGQSLVFMSNSAALAKRVAGYDNTDLGNGLPDAEVYLYHAEAKGGARALVCVSCNPTGGRPNGREIALRINAESAPFFAAAGVPRPDSELYQSRYVSDDGRRVFFDSYDALVLGDTNGKEDVYEWEATGTGGCTTENSSYVAGSEGCLSLITSGRSPDDSEFLDASSTGSDAFFTTTEGLVPQDSGLVDVYDARIEGGFPPPPAPPAGCEGEACQGPPVSPLDTTPTLFAFSGPGNPIPPVLVTSKVVAKPKIKLCKKGAARKKGKCVKRKRSARKGSVGRGRAGRSSRRPAKSDGRAGR